MVPRLVSKCRGKCYQYPRSDSLLHTSVCSHHMTAGCRELEITGPHSAHRTFYSLCTRVGSLLITFPPIHILCAVVHLFGLHKQHLAKQELATNGQHETSCHLLDTDISQWNFCCQDTSLSARVEQKFKCNMTVWYVPSAVCPVHTDVGMTFFASQYLLQNLSN
jgi:hypothetical protein